MKEIKVSEVSSYNGQDMKWTEEMTRSKAKGIFVHTSGNKINTFYPKTTCFFKVDDIDDIISNEHVYVLFVDGERDCMEAVNDDEFRFELTENDKLFYLGEYEMYKTEETRYSYVSRKNEPVYKSRVKKKGELR